MGHMPEETAPRSRRALLAAAAGGAAALAAQAALPLTAAAADPNDVVLGAANSTTTTTSISNTAGGVAFEATAFGAGAGITTNSVSGAGVSAHSGAHFGLQASSDGAAAVYGTSVDGTNALEVADTNHTGVYGWAPTAPVEVGYSGTGVLGHGEDAGVAGVGFWGVVGIGDYGVWGEGRVGVRGEAIEDGGVALIGVGNTTTRYGLRADGKVRLSHRAGRATIGAGKSSVGVTVSGVTTSSRVYAVLNTNRASRYVRAVVPTSNKITIYLNSTVSASTSVAWLVLDA
jgi:hypothetical protein